MNPVLVATTLGKVLSLSWNGDILYALLGIPGVPAERFIFKNQYDNSFNQKLVSFRSPWGDTIPQEALFPGTSYVPSIGFVPDPLDGRKFYVAKPDYNMVVSFRDLFGYDNEGTPDENYNHINEPAYPAQKPKNTYRILLVGDSRVVGISNYYYQNDFHPPNPPLYPRILNMSKQMERELNFQAALDDVPLNYEVLKSTQNAGTLLFLWPTYLLPDVVKRNDIDLVILFMPPTSPDDLPYQFYFDHPMTSEGIPKFENDMEYLLKPPLERIPKGTPRNFYDFCKAHNLVKIEGNNFDFDQNLFSYPQLHDSLVEMYGKPLDVLNKELAGMKTSAGQSVRFLLCNTRTGPFISYRETFNIWVDAAKKYNFPILDLNDEMNAFNLSVFPITGVDSNHLNPDGHVFLGRLMANLLIRDKLIPWK
jgi:hypothetical protein